MVAVLVDAVVSDRPRVVADVGFVVIKTRWIGANRRQVQDGEQSPGKDEDPERRLTPPRSGEHVYRLERPRPMPARSAFSSILGPTIKQADGYAAPCNSPGTQAS